MPPACSLSDSGRARGAAASSSTRGGPRPPGAATLHLQPTPGTDLALANGLLHIAIAGGHVDEEYVAERTTGFEAVRRVAAAYWPDRVERITGVTVAEQRRRGPAPGRG